MQMRPVQKIRAIAVSLCALLFAAALSVAAPAMAQANGTYRTQVVASGLNMPWSIAFLPEQMNLGTALIVERDGGIRLLKDGKLQSAKLTGVPYAYVARQGGLFDLLLDPDFTTNRIVYLSYAGGTRKANALYIAKAVFDGTGLTDVRIIYTTAPSKDTPLHYGGRMAWLPDGTLLVTMGDGFTYRESAQKLDSDLGKVLRLTREGKAAPGNPFADTPGARAEIWTIGHRNPQGLVVHPVSGRVYAHEHGPRGGDELNLLAAGKNYGWPVITSGVDYSGAVISPYTARKGMEQPLTKWVPSIAPSGMTYYDAAMFPEWRGNLFISALAGQAVHRIVLDGRGFVRSEHVLLEELEQRIRDVRQGPDGALYLLTDSPDGELIRVYR